MERCGELNMIQGILWVKVEDIHTVHNPVDNLRITSGKHPENFQRPQYV